MASFGTKHVAYTRTADGGYWWNVKYDLTFQNGTVTVGLDIRLTGDAVSDAKKAAWLNGIKAIWNERGFLSDGTQLYDIKFDVRYVTSGQDQTVEVHGAGDGQGHFDMNNFWVNSDWGDAYDDASAAHEFGHMIGNYDEYQNGATKNDYTTSNTLMSDLSRDGGFQRYFYTIEYETEQYGFSGHNLSTVLAVRGAQWGETMEGTNGKNGIYGRGGNDTINGHENNDFLDGGNDNDTVNGGTGNDIMDGGLNSDRFVFDAKLSASSNVDIIVNFSHTDDTIALENAIFKAVGTAIETAEFYAASGATKAHDSSDRIIYNKSSGWLYYDDDGNKSQGHAAVHFATLDTHPGNVNYTDFIVV